MAPASMMKIESRIAPATRIREAKLKSPPITVLESCLSDGQGIGTH